MSDHGTQEPAGATPAGDAAASGGVADGGDATGHPAVDAVLRSLAQVAAAEPAEQVPAFQAAHQTLRETLAAIDEQ